MNHLGLLRQCHLPRLLLLLLCCCAILLVHCWLLLCLLRWFMWLPSCLLLLLAAIQSVRCSCLDRCVCRRAQQPQLAVCPEQLPQRPAT